jgi:hypothetical protein
MLATLSLALALAVPSPVGPETRYDPRIPTLKEVVGHDFGEEITSPEQIAAYLSALASAAPDRARLVEYARSEEGRPLHVLVVGTPERMARLDEIEEGLRALADPRRARPRRGGPPRAGAAGRVWLLHGVHGNEISSGGRGAGPRPPPPGRAGRRRGGPRASARRSCSSTRLQNPDGRARFLATNRLGRAATPDPEPPRPSTTRGGRAAGRTTTSST